MTVDPLAGAVRMDQSLQDWRAQLLSDVDRIVDDLDAGGVVDPAGCTCNGAICADQGCPVCARLDPELPCPGDRYAGDDDADAASWTPPAAPEQEDFAPAVLELGSPAANLPVSRPDDVPRGVLAHPGWRSRHDDQSRRFDVADRLAGRAALHDVTLADPPELNQGKEGACVGFGVTDAANVLSLLTLPAHIDPAGLLDDSDALTLYHAAQKIDDVPGEDYSGTSVLAGMKAAVAAGLFGGYLWSFGTRSIADAIVQLRRPVVVGVPWYDGMYETGPGGLVTGIGAGRLVGGHCLCLLGLRMKGPQGQPGPFFVWRNSWGAGYGDNGDGYVHHRDLTGLLRQRGEAAIPTPHAQVAR